MNDAHPMDWDAAVAVLQGANEAALLCHVGPDGDALGSMLALGLGLRERGVRVVASFGSAPFVVPTAYADLPGQDLLVAPEDFPTAPPLLITFDTGSPERLGTLGDRVQTADQVLVIDHHVTNTRYGSLHLVDPGAAATAVLVADLIDRLGVPLTADIAAPVYTGLVTDTGSFRYAATTPAVHELAGRLLGTGIRHDLINRAIWDTAPFGYVKVLGRACDRARLEPAAAGGLGLVWTTLSAGDIVGCGLALSDVEAVIDVVRVAAEAEVAVVVKEDPVEPGALRVSTRSKGQIDVGAVCTGLGGGGHRFAAGFTSYDGVEATLARLRNALAGAPHLPA